MTPTLKICILAAVVAAVPVLISAADAPENWKKHCALCHAADGTGATTMGKKLKLKDYTSAAVQAGMKDEEMFTVIKDGVKNEQGKFIMPTYATKLSDDEIKALIDLIRAMKKDG